MKKSSLRQEVTALASILDGGPRVSNGLLSALREEHFSGEFTSEIFTRVGFLLREGKEIPSARLLSNDPTLSQRARNVLKYDQGVASHPRRVRKLKEVEPLVTILDEYRRRRVLHSILVRVAQETQAKAPNIERTLTDVEDHLFEARSGFGGSEITHLGAGHNIDSVLNRVLRDEEGNEIIQTGFKTFDDNTGGFARTNVVLLAANYGGGKSVAGMQLALNMYMLGYSVIVISLEMDEDEYWGRVFSSLSGLPFDLVRLKRLDNRQKAILKKTIRQFKKHGQKRKCRFSVYPAGYVDPWQLCNEIKPYGYDVVIVDYIGLMKPPAGIANDERIQLGETVKALKLIAGKRYLNAVVVGLAQLNDDNRIKYSRAMAEHANFVWWWRYGEREQELKQVIVNQDKARNATCYSMLWKIHFETMQIIDAGLVDAPNKANNTTRPSTPSPIARKGKGGGTREREKTAPRRSTESKNTPEKADRHRNKKQKSSTERRGMTQLTLL